MHSPHNNFPPRPASESEPPALDISYPTVARIDTRRTIADHLQQAILSGDLKAGEQLPPEYELVDRFKVSRASVREALRILEGRGLVHVNHGKGAFVCDVGMASEDSRAFLYAWFGQREMSLDEVLEFRKMLEPQAAALAAERADRGELEGVAQALERMRASVDRHDLHGAVTADIDFHRAIVAATHNQFLLAALDVAGRLLIDMRRITLTRPEGLLTAVTRHEQILRAIEMRDPEEAYENMAAHIGATHANVHAALHNGRGADESPDKMVPRASGHAAEGV
ncbi:MAG: FadR/GntR family transcriptional regulator [Dehalococcoidales bacterium]|nr:FadR/GntR family transcriptional regulator [Dehalococcoidales bacterium]